MDTDDDFLGPVNLGNPVEFTIRELACQSALNIDPLSASKNDPSIKEKKSRSLLEPIRLVSCFYDVAMMGQPIQQGSRHLGITKDL
jgi:hypothetical protein